MARISGPSDGELLAAAVGQPVDRFGDSAGREVVAGQEDALHQVAAALGDHEAEGGQDAARHRHQHAAHSELVGYLRRV